MYKNTDREKIGRGVINNKTFKTHKISENFIKFGPQDNNIFSFHA